MSNGNGFEDLDEDDVATEILFGREYPRKAIQEQIYLCPGDNTEAQRLDHLHEILKIAFAAVPDFSHNLVIAPLSRNTPQKVLDCGFGSAAWAADVARQFPRWTVTGVDIWPFMAPENSLDNLELQVQISDLNDTFTFEPASFDLVQSRFVAGGISASRWPSYLRDIERVLKPGGWVQICELYFNIQSWGGRLEGSALRQWSQEYMRSMSLSGTPRGRKDLRVFNRMNQMIRDARLRLVTERKHNLHLSAWSSDPHEARVGQMMRENFREMLRSLALYPFRHRLSMSQAEFEVLVASANRELDDLANKPYISLDIWIVQKPPTSRR